jgi:hypothetical protein
MMREVIGMRKASVLMLALLLGAGWLTGVGEGTVTGISLGDTLHLDVGEVKSVSASVTMTSAVDAVYWSTSNANVVNIANYSSEFGKAEWKPQGVSAIYLKGVNDGTAVIRCYSGSVSDSMTVTVGSGHGTSDSGGGGCSAFGFGEGILALAALVLLKKRSGR